MSVTVIEDNMLAVNQAKDFFPRHRAWPHKQAPPSTMIAMSSKLHIGHHLGRRLSAPSLPYRAEPAIIHEMMNIYIRSLTYLGIHIAHLA